MYPVIFTAQARADLIDAQDWYENETPGVGRGFRKAVDTVAQRMSANPRQFPQERAPRPALRRFPYALMFVIEADDALTVIACFHGSRDPAHWQKRS